MAVAGKDLSADEAWSELQELLRFVATQPPHRHMAALYTTLRDTLLKSDYQRHLPGFMLQCLTLDRYRDFIHLYDPSTEARLDFLSRSFRNRSVRASRPTRDFLADAEF